MAREIVFRAVEANDLEFTRTTRNDPSVSSLSLGRRFPITEVGELRWFEGLGTGAFPTEATFIVADAATGDPLGLVSLSDIDWISRTAWFGIWIAPAHQGTGVGRRATTLAVDVARHRFGLRRLKLLVLADHTAALAIYAAAGFHEEGRLEGEYLDSGTEHDVLLLACRLQDEER